jgi:hypothetical protein
MAKLIKITSDLVINILHNGLNFPVKEIESIGKVIVMNSRNALSYAIITSHGYLDKTEPDSMYILARDHFRIFNQSKDFDLQEGVFSLSGLRLVTTINNEIQRKPFLKNHEKYILPLEYSGYPELKLKISKVLLKIKTNGLNCNDFIICPISAQNSGLESFFEYVVSVVFNRKMFLTDTQIPFFYGVGTPDVAAYKISNLIELLHKYGFLDGGGSVIDLMSVSSFGLSDFSSEEHTVDESIVFEVKTCQTSSPQIKKYTKTKIFSKAYEVIPVEKESEKYAGLFTINTDGKIILSESSEPIDFEKSIQKEYFRWIEIYLKMYLLANLKTDELETLLTEHDHEINNPGLIDYVKTIPFEELLKSIRNILS